MSELLSDADPDGRGVVGVAKFLRVILPKDFHGKSVAVSQQPELDIFQAASTPRGRTLGMTTTALAPPSSAIRVGQPASEVPERHQLRVSSVDELERVLLRKLLAKISTQHGGDNYAFRGICKFFMKKGVTAKANTITLAELDAVMRERLGVYVGKADVSALFARYDPEGRGSVHVHKLVRMMLPGDFDALQVSE